MINLIPNQQKKEMVKVFHYKLFILFLITVSFALVIIFVAILPSYFLSSARINIIETKLEIQKQEPVPLPDQQTLSVINDLNRKLSIVEIAEKDKFTVSEQVINALIVKKMSSIKITEISYENDPSKTSKDGGAFKKISIQGSAPSREVLLSFRQALEDSNNFKQVDLPISNFVKGSNIKFFLSLMLQ